MLNVVLIDDQSIDQSQLNLVSVVRIMSQHLNLQETKVWFEETVTGKTRLGDGFFKEGGGFDLSERRRGRKARSQMK